MENLKEKYRLSLYTEVIELSSEKVYLVKSSLDDKIYIKKVLSIENYEIYEEIKNLNIANIPKIYEILDMGDELIIIEEYINGYSLKEILDKSKTLDEKKVIEYTLDLINILEGFYSGSSHIIHRDIKPSNIMINNDGILKLIDFDISRIHKTDKSTDTTILGTYGYAAPEQFGFNQSDIRTDIYSIGATMNILLTGKLPVEEVFKGDLSKIILKCIELDPKKRYQNLSDLKRDLLRTYRKHSRVNNPYNIEDKKLMNLKLPGFRSNSILIKILAFLWYATLFLALIGLLDSESVPHNRISNIAFSLALFAFTILYGNYNDIKTILPIINSNKRLVRVLGYIFYTFIILLFFNVLSPS